MRIILPGHRDARPTTGTTPTRKRAEGGFAVLVVMILLVIMVSLAIGNNIALARLQSEMQLVERRQQNHRLVRETNAPATAPVERPSSRQDRAARASNSPTTP